MRKVLQAVVIVILAAVVARAQGIRFGDGQPVWGAAQSGNITVVPNATINFCSYPATGVPCTNRVTTYTDASLNTACPSTRQVTVAGSSSCSQTADAQGNWGVWLAEAGTYAYTVTIGGQSYGPYNVTLSPVNGGSAQFSNLTASATTEAGSQAFSVGSFGITVTNPGVFGYNGLYSSCINDAPGTMCYAASTMAIDATGNSDYAHTVAFNPQVMQSQTKSPSGSSSDYYGVAAGFNLGTGVWPGSGIRVEGPVGAGTAGQIAVAFDMTDGISPTILYARPGCRAATCNSAQIILQGRNSGTLSSPTILFADFLGNLRLRTPGMMLVDTINGADATSTTNFNSSSMAFTANAWDGAKSTSYSWQVFHNINASGLLSVDHLEIQPPSNLPGGVVPQVAVGADVAIAGNLQLGANTVYRCTTAGTLPIGALTITAANCGATADTGLRVK